MRWVASMKLHVSWSSSRVPHSLVCKLCSWGHVSFRWCMYDVHDCRMCSGVCVSVWHVHCAVWAGFILCMWWLSLQWPVLRRKIVVCCFLFSLLMGSCGCLLWVCCLHTSLYFLLICVLISGSDIGCLCCVSFVPSLASMSALSFPGTPQWAGIHWRIILLCSESLFRCSVSSLSMLSCGSPESKMINITAAHLFR